MSHQEENNTRTGLEIAIVGMAGRFPGADDVETFWNNLRDGVETVTFFSDRQLEEAGVKSEMLAHPGMVKASSMLTDVDVFDAAFFDYLPEEAEIMDPQVRLFHEAAWETLENAAVNPETYEGLIGLYAGITANPYWQTGVLTTAATGSERLMATYLNSNFFSTLISYRLNLKGPAVTVQTACSTSLVAIHQACRGLLTGECHMALAGGVTVNFPQGKGYIYEPGMILSEDGHCRAFDAKASGTVSGAGLGIVLLKRLDAAIEDGDNIQALIKGTAINNDGKRKVGYTAPSVEAQAEVIKAALEMAEVEPETVTYIEAHGTGTPLGDPIEIEALKRAFNTDKRKYCAVGAVKSNVGHLDSAAGVAGLIKTVQALKNKQIPPSLHYETPNPKIDFENSPFYVNAQLKQWERNGNPLRAGVSSFGIGGTNAHVVLEEWREPREHINRKPPSESEKYQLILQSAKTGPALEQASRNLGDYLEKNPGIDLADAAYTLQLGRLAFKNRKITVAATVEEAAQTLQAEVSDKAPAYYSETENPPVIFMFPGQGAQYENMGRDLYDSEPAFREELDRCFEILKPIMGYDIKKMLYPDPSEFTFETEPRDINQTAVTQPLVFSIEYALARYLMTLGIKPYAMIGHSIGEYAAACLSGVFTLEDALRTVALRGKLMQAMPAGSMAGVPLPPAELKPYLNENLSLAAVNSTEQCVVSGTNEAIDAFQREMEEKGHKTRRLITSHAFHSAMMDPILEKFKAEVEKITLRTPEMPYISNVTGQWITVEQAKDPQYWTGQLRNAVQFADGLGRLLQEETAIFLEVGPGNVLNTFVKHHAAQKTAHHPVTLLRHPVEKVNDRAFFLSGIGKMWLYGATIDWHRLHRQEKRRRLQLPTYPFEKKKYGRLLNKMAQMFKNISEGNGFKNVKLDFDDRQDNEPPEETAAANDTQERQGLSAPYAPPRNDVEKKMVALWQRFFGIPTISIYDDFFELGGDSIKALGLTPRLHKIFGVDIPLQDFFQCQTIEKVAQYIKEKLTEIHTANNDSGNIDTGDLDTCNLDSGDIDTGDLDTCNLDSGNLDSGDLDTGDIDTGDIEENESIVTGDAKNLHQPFPVTPLQLAYLLGRDNQFEIGGVSTHVYQEMEIAVLPKVFNKALNRMIQRHPMLRAIVFPDATQQILDVKEYEIETENLTHLDKEQQQQRIREVRQRMSHHVFKPDQWPLFEFKIFELTKDNSYIFFSIDHLITDAGSLRIFIRELAELCNNPDKDMPEVEFTYRDYVQAYEELKNSERFQTIKKYWMDRLGDFPTAPQLPLVCKPSEVTSPIFKRKRMEFNPGEWKQLKQIARSRGITPSILVCTAYSEVLSYWSNQTGLALNVTLFNRYPFHKDVNKIIGDFSSITLLGLELKPGSSFWEKAAGIQKNMLEALENRYFDGVEFMRELRRYRNLGAQAIMPIVFTSALFDSGAEYVDKEKEIEQQADEDRDRKDAAAQSISQTSQVYLDCMVGESNGWLGLTWDYVEALFDPRVIDTMFKQYVTILRSILEENREYLLQPPLNQRELIEEFNSTAAEYPKEKNMTAVFEEQAEKMPDHIALTGEGTQNREPVQLTNKELSRCTRQLAQHLRRKGIQTGDVVAVMLPRSVETIIGIYGIIKAGGAYLPIDPDYPIERIRYMLADSKSKVLLARQGDAAGRLADEMEVVDIDRYRENPETEQSKPTTPLPALKPDDSAYVIYTSGTTGKPKGVIIEHRSLLNRLNWMQNQYQIDTRDTLFQKTPYTFDVSVWEIFWWSFTGAKLCLAGPGDEKDPVKLIQLIERNNVTVIHFVPSMLAVFLEQLKSTGKTGRLAALRQVIASGEALTPAHVNTFNRQLGTPGGVKLDNLYGPTEATVDVTYYPCPGGENIEKITIGKPIDNISLYILSHTMTELPLGVPGELCIAGDGLGRGYLNRPELTAERFARLLPRDIRIYRTGDLARWLPDGNIEFLGRIDRQVKLRGFRIELAEIEQQLLKDKNVKAAVLQVKTDATGDNRLCAYIVTEEEPDPVRLKEHLSQSLPEYMIPTFFIKVEKIPLTPNGKIDTRALPDIVMEAEEKYAPPRTEPEERMVQLWTEILDVEPGIIGIDDNFFELGGHSLKANMLLTKVHKEMSIIIPLKDLFKTPTIRGLSGYLKEGETDRFITIEPAETRQYYRLSSAQKRLYLVSRMDEDGVVYNVPYIQRLEGELDKVKLENTFRQLIRRHESFRTAFLMVGEEPVQQIREQVPFEIRHKEVEDPTVDNTREISAMIRNSIRPFDLSKPPLLRVTLIKETDRRYIMIADIHHIISDALSMDIFIKEFAAVYNGSELPPLKLQYKDFSEWQNSPRQLEAIKKQQQYWCSQFEGEIPVLNLPTDHPRPQIQSYEGNTVTRVIEKEDTRALRNYATEQGTTLFTLLLSQYTVFLSKICNQEDIVVGTPIAGRRHADLEPILGVFLNSLALRNYPGGEISFRRFLDDVKDRTLEAFTNQDYPYEDLVEVAGVERDTSRNPLFDTMFSMGSYLPTDTEVSGLRISLYNHERTTSKFDIMIQVTEVEDRLVCIFEYSTALFNNATIETYADYFKKITSRVLENPEKKLAEIELIPEEEKEKILTHFNDTAQEFPKHKTIHRQFEEQVKRTPDKIVQKGTPASDTAHHGTETYEQLNAKADRLARQLQARGIKPGTLVGLVVDRGLEIIAGMLAVLKAGAAYVPIDPQYPQERIKYILADSAAPLALIAGERTKKLELHTDTLNIENIENLPADNAECRNIEETAQPGDLAYVIYTSGSTGKPKGVMIEHITLVNLTEAMKQIIHIGPGDSLLSLTTISFDIFGLEAYLPMTSGATVVIGTEEEQMNPIAAAKAIKKHKINILQVTPSRLTMLIAEKETADSLKGLDSLLVGGEELIPSLKERLNDTIGTRAKFFNGYGPTEATIYSTVKDVGKGKTLNIGKPVANTTAYILDKYNTLQPIGIPGELAVGGAGLARGYVNRPELTAEKFLHTNQGNIYKTGDLAKWLPDGNIQYLGRMDHQVKIRGYRIELGEIENRLLKHPDVQKTVVTCNDDAAGDKYICAYYVPRNENPPETEQLKEFLAQTLTDYMLPSYFVSMEQIPLTTNGKIDRKALPAPELKAGEGHVAPRNELEKTLTQIFADVLAVDENIVGIDANFFAMGGHSLKATVMIARIHKELDVRLQLTDVFLKPTARGLADKLKTTKKKTFTRMEIAEKKEYYPLSYNQKRLWFINQVEPGDRSYRMYSSIPLRHRINEEHIIKTLEQIVYRHEMLRTGFKEIDGNAVQFVRKTIEINFERIDISMYRGEEKWNQQVRLFHQIREARIMLNRPPLFIMKLIKLEEENYELIMDLHHIICDGWSMEILQREFIHIYENVRHGKKHQLPPMEFQYKDYSQWQNKKLKNPALKEKSHRFWLEKIGDNLPELRLPRDFESNDSTQVGAAYNFQVSKEVKDKLKDLAIYKHTGIYMIIFTAFNLLLARLSGQNEIVTGILGAGRDDESLQNIVGFFVNTMLCKTDVDYADTFDSFLEKTGSGVMEIMQHQDYPIELVLDDLNRRFPEIKVLFNMFNMKETMNAEIAQHEPMHSKNVHNVKFELTLYALEYKNGLEFSIHYRSDIFTKERVEFMMKQFQTILEMISKQPDKPLKEYVFQKKKRKLKREIKN